MPNARARRRPLAAAIALAIALLALPSTAEELTITYLANEGFLLAAGDAKVLVDALFGTGIRGYPAVPTAERRRLEAGRAPYDGVDLVLASHHHGDHFDAAAVARFLEASPETVFLSTEQARRRLLDLPGTRHLAPRVLGHWPAEGTVLSRRFADGVSVEILNLHHGRDRPEVQNLGSRIGICGLTVLHVGDTEADADEMRGAGLGEAAVDVALLPSWYLRPGRWRAAAEGPLRAERIVAMHLPAAGAPRSFFYGGARDLGELRQLVQNGFPDAWIPEASGATRRFACRTGS